MAPEFDPAGQEDAVLKAKTLFRAVADTYHSTATNETENAKTSTTPAAPSQASTSSVEMEWLASMLHVNINPDALNSVVMSPLEMYEDEISRYFRFGGGPGSHTDPLGWWKVSDIFRSVNQIRHAYWIYLLEKRIIFPNYCANGARLLGYTSNKCLGRADFLEIAAHLC